MELRWSCPWCGQDLSASFSGRPIVGRSRKTAANNLLLKVDDHIDFHVWQFGNEIEYGWLEEDQE